MTNTVVDGTTAFGLKARAHDRRKPPIRLQGRRGSYQRDSDFFHMPVFVQY